MSDDQINAAISQLYGWSANYCNDLNAMHEAEKVLDETQAEDYEELLGEYGFHSTARKRAEAFLMTLGKWKEVQG